MRHADKECGKMIGLERLISKPSPVSGHTALMELKDFPRPTTLYRRMVVSKTGKWEDRWFVRQYRKYNARKRWALVGNKRGTKTALRALTAAGLR